MGTRAWGVLLSVAGLLSAAPAAQAAFHEILVREVHAGGAGNDSYVVLQAYRGGQNFVGGHSVTAYDETGKSIGGFPFVSMVSSGANQMTILVADTGYAASFPGAPAPDGVSETLNLKPTGGAVCWAGFDCVSWGSFGGATSPASGTPVDPAGIPDGTAIRRSIAAGCATLLELGDDSNDSAIDFADASPNPRSNATPPSEQACGAAGGPSQGGGGSGGRGAPETKLTRRPAGRTRDRTPTFRFASDEAGSTFQCKLDGKPYRSCHSPFTTGSLSPGRHTFRVRARDRSGRLDPSPALDSFRILPRH